MNKKEPTLKEQIARLEKEAFYHLHKFGEALEAERNENEIANEVNSIFKEQS